MYKIGDIIPYYVDWDSKEPKHLEGYGKIIEILPEPFAYDLIYDEQPEGSQEVYTRIRVKLLTQIIKNKVMREGVFVNELQPHIIVRNLSVLKQIGIHNSNVENTKLKYEKRNPYRFQEGNIAKLKSNITQTIKIIFIDKQDMYRIYNEKSTEYSYKPIAIDKRNYLLLENDEFKIDYLLNIKFKTISCENNCPIHWKPKYIHQCQNIFNVITGNELDIDIEKVKQAVILKKQDYEKKEKSS